MKVKVAVEYEIELEVNNPAVRELRDWYKDHPVAYWKDVPEGLMDKAENAILSTLDLSKVPFEDLVAVIAGVYDKEGNPILEY